MKNYAFKKEVIDASTGEVIEAVAFIPEVRDRNFVKLYKVFSEKILNDLCGLNGEAKLLCYLMAKTMDLPMQSDLWIPINYEVVANELGVSVRTLKGYFKRLKELGYIDQFKSRNTVFRIRPEFLYKGNLSKYRTDLSKWSEHIKNFK